MKRWTLKNRFLYTWIISMIIAGIYMLYFLSIICGSDYNSQSSHKERFLVNVKAVKKKWPAEAILKRYITLEPGVDCPRPAEEMRYLSKSTAGGSMLATILIPLLILIPAFFNVSILTIAVIFAVALIAILSIHLTLELASEEETWNADIG